MSFINSDEQISPYKSLAAGALSGLVTRFCISPLDVIKIRLQLLNENSKPFTIFNNIKAIVKNESVFAFWKGNIPAELLYLSYSSIQFTTFNILNNSIPHYTNAQNAQSGSDGEPSSTNKRENLRVFFIGSVSGFNATLLSYPFDVLRTKMISNKDKKFLKIFQILNNYSLKKFFNGSLLGLIQVSLNSGLSLSIYNYLNLNNDNSKLNGLYSGILSKFIIYPLDLIKRKIQISGFTNSNSVNKPVHLNQIIHDIFIKNGIRGFYNGLLPTLLKSAPSTAISLYTFEIFIKFL